MGVPSKEELAAALAEAVRLRESGNDEHHLAKTVLNLNYRNHQLEKVMACAKHFLHSGLASEEHTALVKSIEEAEQANRQAGYERQDFGLE